jgi:hypothetical protein
MEMIDWIIENEEFLAVTRHYVTDFVIKRSVRQPVAFLMHIAIILIISRRTTHLLHVTYVFLVSY